MAEPLKLIALWINRVLACLDLQLSRARSIRDLDRRAADLAEFGRLSSEQIDRLEREKSSLRLRLVDLEAERAELTARAQTLRWNIAALELDNRQMGREIEGAKSLAESWPARAAILAIAQLLVPRRPVGFAMRRVGRKHDGGYVIVDDLDRITTLVSLGVGHDASFDLEFAERAAEVHQYDDTIHEPPVSHGRFHFTRAKVAATEGEDRITLQRIAATDCDRDLNVLKIDIEGDEWPVLDATPEQSLLVFAQIICEFHWFSRCVDPDWSTQAQRVLGKLRRGFDVVHVHGNNCADYKAMGNVAFPEVLEVTFARRADYVCDDVSRMFPTKFDDPNEPARPDIKLGSFHFE